MSYLPVVALFITFGVQGPSEGYTISIQIYVAPKYSKKYRNVIYLVFFFGGGGSKCAFLSQLNSFIVRAPSTSYTVMWKFRREGIFAGFFAILPSSQNFPRVKIKPI